MQYDPRSGLWVRAIYPPVRCFRHVRTGNLSTCMLFQACENEQYIPLYVVSGVWERAIYPRVRCFRRVRTGVARCCCRWPGGRCPRASTSVGTLMLVVQWLSSQSFTVWTGGLVCNTGLHHTRRCYNMWPDYCYKRLPDAYEKVIRCLWKSY